MYRVPASPQRLLCGFGLTFLCRSNVSLLIPFRLLMMVVHFTALVCVSDGSDAMIRGASLPSNYMESEYRFLRRATDGFLAGSFLCLFFNVWGVVTARTLRSGLLNIMHGCFHAAAAVLLIVAWQMQERAERIWHVFYIFSVIPTGLEAIALCESYCRGTDNFF
ncbi:hypothetical protein TcG_00385 [Trypanosoma cruzi]|uniref:Uncharacterized protein n=1 Tax=Trypanosoma cruzi TaxID=5693 RepID=A0A2V2V5S8_TRYCR|nr:putative transmembrane protein [Trypanosoma cruzi]PBJ80739.1 hypothetical protein BCY84_00936 [Trypanosoma cruzi cruzi]PWU91709.1 hypothetical protein C4B63_42g94 [Trypanosoma cruzi]RNF24985.1 hypothetical protein TcG_00385 [Trypanosoma cruzi]